MEDVTAAGQSGVQLGLYSRLGHRGQLSSKGARQVKSAHGLPAVPLASHGARPGQLSAGTRELESGWEAVGVLCCAGSVGSRVLLQRCHMVQL
jgi:hypothetical protein